MRVTVTITVVGGLRMLPIGCVKRRDEVEIRERIYTIKAAALLRSARIL